VVYVGSEDNNLYALNGGTGAKVWSYNVGLAMFSSSPAVADGLVYVGSDVEGGVYAFGLFDDGNLAKEQVARKRPDPKMLRPDFDLNASKPNVGSPRERVGSHVSDDN
jgi:hypothetical protein